MTENENASNGSANVPKLVALPDEVLTTILSYLDPVSLTKTLQVNQQFFRVGTENLLWRDLVLKTFRFWDDEDFIEDRQLNPAVQRWKDLFTIRKRKINETVRCIRRMVDGPTGRLRLAQRVQSMGYGVKDVLLDMYHNAPPETLLAQRYWVYSMLGCINRSFALQRLQLIKFREDRKNPTEEALAALDMFVLGADANGDIGDTFSRLDEMVAAVRAAHPEIKSKTPRERACIIAEFLRQKNWIGISEGAEYYSIENQFLGIALRSSSRNSLPLISCVIYCYVCRAFDLRAQPCSFPNHVHAVVQPLLDPNSGLPQTDLDGRHLPADFVLNTTTPDSVADLLGNSQQTPTETPSDLTHLYIDPFHSSEPVPIATLNQQLTFTVPSMQRAQRAAFLVPAAPRGLLIRTAHNIIRSIREAAIREHTLRATGGHIGFGFDLRDADGNRITIDLHAAAYAALYTHVLFATSAHNVTDNIEDLQAYFVHHFPEDIPNYMEYIKPFTRGFTRGFDNEDGVDELVSELLNQDDQLPVPKLREDVEGSEPIKFKVGTVFKHRRQGYTAVIYGWDSTCKMDERWIRGNNVDRLPNGRGQPFYNA